MIEALNITNIASFGNEPEPMEDLSTFNFIFGANGSGKTTISRLIADGSCFQECTINWRGGTVLQTFVYNKDFIERNFNQSSTLKGVFTLGEKDIETLNKIDKKKKDIDEITRDIETLTQTLYGSDGNGGKNGELNQLENEIKIKCWAQKQKHDPKLQGAFTGYRNNADKFKDKIIKEWDTNSADLTELTEIEKKAETLFGETPIVEKTIEEIDTENILKYETDPILKKRVIGKEDVDISAMINKLGNSDWVKQGIAYYEANDSICPFCQQKTDSSFSQSLSEYFDDTFEKETNLIENLVVNYSSESERIKQTILTIIDDNSRFLDIESLKAERELLDTKITVNNQKLSQKKKEPSLIVELESLNNILDKISELIRTANNKISQHNSMVNNLSTEQDNLKNQVWKYLIEVELKSDLEAYDKSKKSIDKAILSITRKINESQDNKKKIEIELMNLEKRTTSIQPTIDAINGLLNSFGFNSFAIAEAEDKKSYKLIRPDGTEAKDTLSEGEKNFVTFLYFYHLLKGSDSEAGVTTDRVVVFDDPVSSLDSDILFVVSSLIKGLFEDVRKNTGLIKQIFILTHNVYFHKEVSFNPKRRNVAMREETFWVVRRHDKLSKLEKYNSNPIKTSYELLWEELKKSNKSNLTMQNTLRRILESYFKILGGIDFDKICEMFDGQQKLICKSLFSWIHAGSHYPTDDLYVSINDTEIDNYLCVFKEIFIKTDHIAHYNMMMGEEFVERTAAEVLNE